MSTRSYPFSVGQAWGAFTLPKDVWSVDKYGDKIQTTYKTKYSTWKKTSPAIGSAHPVAKLAVLVTKTARQLQDSYLCEVTLSYETQTGDESTIPATEISENGSTQEIDIRSHEDFEAKFKQYWDSTAERFNDSAPDYLKGVTKFVAGSSTVTVTIYSVGEPSDVQSSLGKILTPPGRGSAGQWLVLTGGKNKRGAYWARTLTYLYSSKKWPTEIYG